METNAKRTERTFEMKITNAGAAQSSRGFGVSGDVTTGNGTVVEQEEGARPGSWLLCFLWVKNKVRLPRFRRNGGQAGCATASPSTMLCSLLLPHSRIPAVPAVPHLMPLPQDCRGLRWLLFYCQRMEPASRAKAEIVCFCSRLKSHFVQQASTPQYTSPFPLE